MILDTVETVHSVSSSRRSDTRAPEVAEPRRYRLERRNKHIRQIRLLTRERLSVIVLFIKLLRRSAKCI